jgi:hypothetical protein
MHRHHHPKYLEMSKLKQTFNGYSKTISSYADYIEANFHDKYDRYAWLVGFLRNAHPNPPAKNLSLPAQLFIIDSSNENGGTVTSRKFTLAKDDPTADPHLVSALTEKAHQTRLIFLQYRSFESLDPMCIDLLGLHCGLDPGFFAVHFECGFDQTGQDVSHYASHSLPSERSRFLQIQTDEWTFMTATWKVVEDRCTCEMHKTCMNMKHHS